MLKVVAPPPCSYDTDARRVVTGRGNEGAGEKRGGGAVPWSSSDCRSAAEPDAGTSLPPQLVLLSVRTRATGSAATSPKNFCKVGPLQRQLDWDVRNPGCRPVAGWRAGWRASTHANSRQTRLYVVHYCGAVLRSKQHYSASRHRWERRRKSNSVAECAREAPQARDASSGEAKGAPNRACDSEKSPRVRAHTAQPIDPPPTPPRAASLFIRLSFIHITSISGIARQ